MRAISIPVRGLLVAVLVIAAGDLVRADIVIPDYGYTGSSTGIYRFDENTGAAIGTQPFASIGPADPGYEADEYFAEGSAYGPDGNLYVGFYLPGHNVGEVREYNSVTGAYIGTAVTPGEGGLVQPGDVKFIGGQLYVADHSGTTVDTYTLNSSGAAATTTPGPQIDFGANSNPSGLLVDTRPVGLGGTPGTLLVSLYGTNSVVQYNFATQAITPYVTGNGSPGAMAFGPDGSLYLANVFSDNIQHFDSAGNPLASLPALPDYFQTGAFPGGIVYTQGGQLLVSTLVPYLAPVVAYTGDPDNPWAPFASATGLNYGGPVRLTPISGDGNADGIVNIADLTLVGSNWLSAGPTGDVNGDGIVNIADLTAIGSNWLGTDSIFTGGVGTSLVAATSVPEPSTIALALVGVTAVFVGRLRRRRNG